RLWFIGIPITPTATTGTLIEPILMIARRGRSCRPLTYPFLSPLARGERKHHLSRFTGEVGAGICPRRVRALSRPSLVASHYARSGRFDCVRQKLVTRGRIRRSHSGPSRWDCERRTPTAACLLRSRSRFRR